MLGEIVGWSLSPQYLTGTHFINPQDEIPQSILFSTLSILPSLTPYTINKYQNISFYILKTFFNPSPC